MDTTGITNPKRIIAGRETAAGLDDPPDLKKGVDMGDLSGGTPMMTQAQFSGYAKRDPNDAGFAKVMKARK